MTITIKTKLGYHRGSRRIWIEGTNLVNSGFLPGVRFNVAKYKKYIVIQQHEQGIFKVSRRIRGERIIPIIDLTFRELITIFKDVEIIQSTIDREKGKIIIKAYQK